MARPGPGNNLLSPRVRVGDVLSFAQRGAVRVLRVGALPARRGPAAEARALYTDIAEGREASSGLD